MSAYLLKQQVLFGTLATTSYAGYHYCGLIWYKPSPKEVAYASANFAYQYPKRAKEIGGDYYKLAPEVQKMNSYSLAADSFVELSKQGVPFKNGDYNNEKTAS